MKLIKSYLIRNNLQLFLLFLAAYFIIRFFGLMLIPVYLDEAIYINWADMFRKSSNFAYLSMQDGKTPLYFWITGTMMKFLKDPLLSSRLV